MVPGVYVIHLRSSRGTSFQRSRRGRRVQIQDSWRGHIGLLRTLVLKISRFNETAIRHMDDKKDLRRLRRRKTTLQSINRKQIDIGARYRSSFLYIYI